MDERWVDVTAEELLERSTACWNEQFPVAVDQLLAMPVSRGVIVEGPGAAPWLVAPVIRDSRQAIFLVPDETLRNRVVADRERRGTSVAYATTRDPERARSNHRERDRRWNSRIEMSCRELGLRFVGMDDPLDLDASLALVEGHFAPRLPTVLNV